jgi:two-component system chemotaxis response regulator CheY
MKILIVDDSKLSRNTLKRLFDAGSNLETAEASTGIEALDMHRIFEPDIIFMDINMPALDGLSTLKILKMIDPAVRIVIISSAGGQKSVTLECLKHGAAHVLSKPVTKEALLDTLRLTQNVDVAGDAL